MGDEIKIGSVWQHLKTGNFYEVISTQGRIEATGRDAVIYKSCDYPKNSPWWVRPIDEFMDGRFVMTFDPSNTATSPPSSSDTGAT